MTMPRLLAVDIGNTEMSMGVYHEASEGPRLERVIRLPSSDRLTADQLFSLLHPHLAADWPERLAVVSVVPHLTAVWEDLAPDRFPGGARFLSLDDIPGIRVLLDHPEEAGMDRVINAWMGFRRYGAPLIVVDMGTATTFDVVDADGNYRGGVIAPGVNLFAESLARRTARLPRIDLKPPISLLGRNTVDALRSGIVRGHAFLVEGILRGLKEELGPHRVVATGGLMHAVRPVLDSQFEAFDATLTLDGIAAIVTETAS